MDYRVEELARAAGVGVDTIRFYQSRRLLPPPRREGRTALYGEAHLERVRRIRELNQGGLTLEGVRRVLDSPDRGVRDALLGELAESEGARSFTRAELAEHARLPESLLIDAERAGLLQPRSGNGQHYTEADRRALEAGRALLDAGVPLSELLPLAAEHARHVEALAERSVSLFRDWVRHDGPGGAARPREEVTEAFRTLLPAITTLVALHFQRTLVACARERLAEAGESDDLQAAVAATESSRLRVSWS